MNESHQKRLNAFGNRFGSVHRKSHLCKKANEWKKVKISTAYSEYVKILNGKKIETKPETRY